MAPASSPVAPEPRVTRNSPHLPLILLIGTGHRLYRGYAFDALTARHKVVLIDHTPPTWQADKLVDHAVADLLDPVQVLGAARALAAKHTIGGVLTWDEYATVTTAQVAQELGLPTSPPQAITTARNKAAARARFDAHQVPSAPWARATTLAETRRAAEQIGFPVVLKPASAGGSFGVIRVDEPAEVAEAYAFTAQAAAGQGSEGTGILVEGYLSGPEISVEVASHHGSHHVVAVTVKTLGPEPFFEETGHLVCGLPDPEGPATRVAVQALDALGITHGISHVELRLTPTGPRVIEVNCRLGGDLIPHLVHLATGVDLVATAADLAAGRTPTLVPTRARVAAIRFLYPETAGHIAGIRIDPELTTTPWCERAVLTQARGDTVTPPPAGGLLDRLAHVVVTAPTPSTCRQRLETAAAAIRTDIVPNRGSR
jgi:biotin carboxylase